jgi:hypothetical protein
LAGRFSVQASRAAYNIEVAGQFDSRRATGHPVNPGLACSRQLLALNPSQGREGARPGLPWTGLDLQERLKHDAEATRVGLSTATRKASVSLAERDGDEVVYVSARLKDVVSSAAQLHGWNQPAGVNVNIANIPMPSAEERAEMDAIDRKLDAIAAKLKDTPISRVDT